MLCHGWKTVNDDMTMNYPFFSRTSFLAGLPQAKSAQDHYRCDRLIYLLGIEKGAKVVT